MSARIGKVSPEVALIVKRIEVSEGWTVQDRQRRFDIFPPGQTVPIALSKDADATDLRRAQSAFSRFGLDKAKAKQAPSQPTETVTVNTLVVDPYPTWTIFEKAKKVWKKAKDHAVANGAGTLQIGGVEYFLLEGKPLSYFIAQVLPKMRHYDGPGGQREVYDYLRSTGHCVRERQEDETSLWVVRSAWTDQGVEVVVRNPRRAVSDYERERLRKEGKVTAKEAGEDREPGPVTITKVEPTPAPEVPSPAAMPEASEAAKALAEQRAREAALTCPECKAEDRIAPFVAKNPQGLAAHRKALHGVNGTTYTPSVVGKISADSPLAEVGTAMEMLRETVMATVARAIDPGPYEQRIEEAEREARFHKADADLQRERAERAEQILGCIRLAFDTMPVSQAVGETLGLLPPVTDA